MKNRIIVSILSFFFICVSSKSFAQPFDSLLNELDTKYPQEKVYLHFDKDFYNPGEKIWFKAYLTASGLPSVISKTLYAELVDEKGNILQRKIMPIVYAGAASCFDLPDTVLSPNLYVRSYTTWMLNFDSTLLFTKPIYIILPATSKKTITRNTYSIAIFPEGGDLITGISSRVAFKATDNEGTPVNINGSIVDNSGKKITVFSSVHDGMGYFNLTPVANTKYKALWKDKDGQAHETPLPDIKDEGVVLSTENKENEIIYTLSRPENASADFTSFFVIAQMQQQPVYSARINMSRKTVVNAPIPTDSLADGILQITVFNAAQLPVAERIIFINHNNYSFITDLHSLEKNLNKRGRNVLQVDVGGTLLTNLSIAVTDEAVNPVKSDNRENIYSQLLLSSDLKGYVYNPAYYFLSDEDSVKQHLDLVMMTNGWRRFKWEDLLKNNFPKITHPVENFISVKGKVVGLSSTQLSGRTINGILKTKNDGTKLLFFPVSKDGQFSVDDMYFFDTARLYYQFNNDKERTLTSSASFVFDYSIVKFPPQLLRSQKWATIATAPDSAIIKKNRSFNKFLLDQHADEYKIKSLKEITVVSKLKSKKDKLDDDYTSGFFSSADIAASFVMEDDPSALSSTSILQYLQGKVAGLQISPLGTGSATWRGSETDLYIDEMKTDVSAIQNIPVTDVAYIKVFRPPFFGSFGGGAGGAVAIYLKKGASQNSGLTKGLDYSLIYGYSVIKEFYSPDYSVPNTSVANDIRTTLYWNPNIIMDKKTRRVTLPFFNSDYCKKIRVVIEGINEAGQLTREERVFE